MRPPAGPTAYAPVPTDTTDAPVTRMSLTSISVGVPAEEEVMERVPDTSVTTLSLTVISDAVSAWKVSSRMVMDSPAARLIPSEPMTVMVPSASIATEVAEGAVKV